MPKAAAIFVIALVLVAAVLVHPGRARRPLASRPFAVHAVALPGITLPTPSTAIPEPDRNRRRGPASLARSLTRVGLTRDFTEMPGTSRILRRLDARPLLTAGDSAPAVVAAPTAAERPGHVSRALGTAADQTSGALRTAARAIRSVF